MGDLLDEFVLSSGANAMLVGPDGGLVDTGAELTVQAVYEDDAMIVTASEQESAVSYHSRDTLEGDTVAVTMSEQATITAEVAFAGQSESYTLYVTPRIKAENLAVRALVQMAPWLLLVLLAFSLLGAFFYSRYITRPIVRMSGIAGKMAELDFHWTYGEKRRDEIGKLGRSLDQLARRLDTALTDLEIANQALRGEVERERELDRQRMAFFNAASHELKTPVTILKGQLSGMLEGVGVLPGSGQIPAAFSSGNGTDGESGAGDAGDLPDGDGVCGYQAGASGFVRFDRTAVDPGCRVTGAT